MCFIIATWIGVSLYGWVLVKKNMFSTIIFNPGKDVEVYDEPNNSNCLMMFLNCIGVCVYYT